MTDPPDNTPGPDTTPHTPGPVDQPPTEADAPPATRRKRWRFVPLLVMLAAAIAIIIGFHLHSRSVDATWRDALSTWRDAGGHTSLQTIAPAPVPDADNAALLYLEAAEQLSRIEHRELLLAPSQITDSDLELLMQETAAIRLMLLEAIEKPACVWPIDYSGDVRTFSQSLPSADQLRPLLQLVIAQAIYHTRQAEPDAAQRTLFALDVGFAMNGHLAQTHHPAAQLLVMNRDLRLCAVLEGLLPHLEVGPDARLPHLDARNPRAPAAASVRTEAAILINEVEQGRSMGSIPAIVELHPMGLPWWYSNAMHKKDMTYFAKQLPRVAEQIAKSLPEQFAKWPPAPREEPYYAQLSPLLLAGFDDYNLIIARTRTRLQLARLALALHRHHAAHGRWPDDLAPFGDLAVDPACNEPFIYQRMEGGFILETRPDSPGHPNSWSR